MKTGVRALSPHPRYSLVIFPAREQVIMDARGYGSVQVLEEGILAEFMQGGLFDYEIDYVLEHFQFTGLPDGVSPLTRVGVFDVETFCQRYPEKAKGNMPGRAEMVVQITERLQELQEQFPGQFIVVEPPYAPSPWPSYDAEPLEEVLKLQERLQIAPEVIRAYEEENQNRAEVMSAMLTLEGNLERAAEYDQPAAPEPPENDADDSEPEPESGEAADAIVVEP